MNSVNAAPMMRSPSAPPAGAAAATADRFFVFGNEPSCVGTLSYRIWYDVVPQAIDRRGKPRATARESRDDHGPAQHGMEIGRYHRPARRSDARRRRSRTGRDGT